MSEAKKKDANLDQNSMDDVKGGIPYEDPGIINLGEPGEPGEPGTTASGGQDGCRNGHKNIYGEGCVDGYGNEVLLGCMTGIGVAQD